jgi:hypothetical protein
MSSQTIVITSIFLPTQAVIEFSKIPGWKLIVVGDKKTPKDWECNSVMFLSSEIQEKMSFKIAKSLPWNHYSRKMLGYLIAIKDGANIIVDTDDDNIPQEGWSFPQFEGNFCVSGSNKGFVNIYRSFKEMHIWPRGFPLSAIQNPSTILNRDELTWEMIQVGIWQGLADGDPDVDAIYRLTNNRPCIFDKGVSIVLQPETICPFNSQNTAFRRELFPLLYLPAFVSFRFTDILRGLVAQPIMLAAGFHLGCMNATVFQERNFHNYLNDFELEIPCYLQVENVLDIVKRKVKSSQSIESNLLEAYQALNEGGIVCQDELSLLADWLQDLESVIQK